MLNFNRTLVFLHRWSGIVLCPIIVLWFFSGIVMLYVGYPKLTSQERFSRLPVLDETQCCAPLTEAWRALRSDVHPSGVRLTSVAGQPVYRFELPDGLATVDARTGEPIAQITRERAVRSAQAFIPEVEYEYRGQVQEDRWTRGARLNAHRPLHVVQMRDAAATRLYVSSTSGEVVRDATRRERAWNYVGPWLHWLHAFRAWAPTWRAVVITLSLASLALALTGLVVGVMRWRFRGAYGSGRKTPYKERYMRWHHIAGLIFAALTLTWVFSGLMSLNPWGVLGRTMMSHGGAHHSAHLRPDLFAIQTREAIAELQREFPVKEIEWHVLNDTPYLLARGDAGETRIKLALGAGGAVIRRLTYEALLQAARAQVPGASVLDVEERAGYDMYYYAHSAHTLRGDEERPLPVLRVQFDDPDQTWVYMSPATGAVALTQTSAQRVERWVFSLLHSWDLRALTANRPVWDVFMLAMSLGGLAIGVTGVVIGLRRVRSKLRA